MYCISITYYDPHFYFVTLSPHIAIYRLTQQHSLSCIVSKTKIQSVRKGCVSNFICQGNTVTRQFIQDPVGNEKPETCAIHVKVEETTIQSLGPLEY